MAMFLVGRSHNSDIGVVDMRCEYMQSPIGAGLDVEDKILELNIDLLMMSTKIIALDDFALVRRILNNPLTIKVQNISQLSNWQPVF